MPKKAGRSPDQLLDDRVQLKLAANLETASICCKGYTDKQLKRDKSSAGWTKKVMEWLATETEICRALDIAEPELRKIDGTMRAIDAANEAAGESAPSRPAAASSTGDPGHALRLRRARGGGDGRAAP